MPTSFWSKVRQRDQPPSSLVATSPVTSSCVFAALLSYLCASMEDAVFDFVLDRLQLGESTELEGGPPQRGDWKRSLKEPDQP